MRLELKICERCGALWLRPQDRNDVYCAPCTPVMHAMRRLAPRKPVRPAPARLAKAGAR